MADILCIGGPLDGKLAHDCGMVMLTPVYSDHRIPCCGVERYEKRKWINSHDDSIYLYVYEFMDDDEANQRARDLVLGSSDCSRA